MTAKRTLRSDGECCGALEVSNIPEHEQTNKIGMRLFLRWPESFPGRAVVGVTDRHVQIRHGDPVRHALLKIGEHVVVRVCRDHEGEARASMLAEFDDEASPLVGADDVN